MKLDELEAKYEELGKEIEKLKNQKVESKKRWRAEYNGEYYFILDNGAVCKSSDTFTMAHDYRYAIGNYFETKEQAEKYSYRQILLQRYADFIAEITEEPLRWGSTNQTKYALVYNVYMNHVYKIEYIADRLNRIQGVLYTTNLKLVELAKERFADEELRLILGVTK